MPAGAHGSGLSAPVVALPRPARIRSRLRSVPMSGSGPHEVAIRGECPEREVRAVSVVLQIKHPRETWCGELRISPETIRLLCTQQVFDAAAHSDRARLPDRHQPKECPCRLVRRAVRLLVQVLLARVPVIALAPAAIRILPADEPGHRALYGLVIRTDARLSKRGEHRPRPVDVV